MYNNYFEQSNEEREVTQRVMKRRLSDLWFMQLTEEDFDGTLEDFMQQCYDDMILVENYEGAQTLLDIKRSRGWH